MEEKVINKLENFALNRAQMAKDSLFLSNLIRTQSNNFAIYRHTLDGLVEKHLAIVFHQLNRTSGEPYSETQSDCISLAVKIISKIDEVTLQMTSLLEILQAKQGTLFKNNALCTYEYLFVKENTETLFDLDMGMSEANQSVLDTTNEFFAFEEIFKAPIFKVMDEKTPKACAEASFMKLKTSGYIDIITNEVKVIIDATS